MKAIILNITNAKPDQQANQCQTSEVAGEAFYGVSHFRVIDVEAVLTELSHFERNSSGFFVTGVFTISC